MTRALTFQLLSVLAFQLLLCGCVSRAKLATGAKVKTPPLPFIKNVQTAAVLKGSGVESSPALPSGLKPITLTWDNPNDGGMTPFMLTDLWSTTNLLQAFTHKLFVPAFSNSVTLMPTNAAEFYICRFVLTNHGQLDYSEWNR